MSLDGPSRTIIVEPVQVPERQAPVPEPVPQPVTVPEREKVPA